MRPTLTSPSHITLTSTAIISAAPPCAAKDQRFSDKLSRHPDVSGRADHPNQTADNLNAGKIDGDIGHSRPKRNLCPEQHLSIQTCRMRHQCQRHKKNRRFDCIFGRPLCSATLGRGIV